MSHEIDLDNPPRRKRPWGATFGALLAIAALAGMPFLAGEPDGEKMPDMVRFLGRFHPLLLHLPIGVFVLIVLQEMMAIVSREPRSDRIFPMFFGAGSAILAVLAGFLLYHGGGYEGSETAERHLWAGLAFAGAALITFIFKAWSVSTRGTQVPFRLMLFASVGVMGFASHDGASLTHGSDYLTQYAPDPVRKLLGFESKPKLEEQDVKPLEEQIVFTEIVQPVLNLRCVECHKEDKAKGKLRMDTYEMLVKGGKEGSAIEPGSAEDSNIIYRIELPVDDEEHMPPEGKKDVEPHELVVLKWWLDQGADPSKTAGEMKITDEVREAIGKMTPAARVIPAAKTTVRDNLPSEDLRTAVAEIGGEFPGGLTFESQESSNLTFTGVSLRQNLTDENFAKLGPVLHKLVSVDLSATAITDRSVALLAAAENLRLIRLSETSIGDESIETLLKLQNLESINLFGTKVTDAGVKKLAALPNLKRLYLWQTEVSGEAIAELKAKLPELEIITGI